MNNKKEFYGLCVEAIARDNAIHKENMFCLEMDMNQFMNWNSS